MSYDQTERLVKSAEKVANAWVSIAETFAKIAASYAEKG